MRALPTLAVLLALVAAVPAAEAGCPLRDAARACADLDAGDGRAWAGGGGGPAQAAVSAEYGAGFHGNYVYVIGTQELGQKLHAHGGAGLVDRDLDGVYEDACACGAVQTVVYVPFGVGLEDTDGDGLPDGAYAEPRLA